MSLAEENVEPMNGIEPLNLFLTKEALYRLSYMGFQVRIRQTSEGVVGQNSHKKNGAGDEARTRDIQLGRLKLYQLSYSRIINEHSQTIFKPLSHHFLT